MIEESTYCSDPMKKLFNKELAIAKEDNKSFENSTKCWICDNYYIDNDVKVRNHCHRDSAHRDCNVNLKLNHKILLKFRSLNICDSRFIIKS